MKIAVLTLTESGHAVAEKIAGEFLACDIVPNPGKGRLSETFRKAFDEYQGLVCIMATGIVVRMIAPLVIDKYHDPAVVVIDDAARFAISLLSGHEGGANWLAYRVAALIDAEPIVTTASDTNKSLCLGIGCRAGVSSDAVREALLHALQTVAADTDEVRLAATIEEKRTEEGLVAALSELEIPLRIIPKQAINQSARDFAATEAAMRHLGVKAVAEPCALLSGRDTRLILPKMIHRGVTVAIAREGIR